MNVRSVSCNLKIESSAWDSWRIHQSKELRVSHMGIREVSILGKGRNSKVCLECQRDSQPQCSWTESKDSVVDGQEVSEKEMAEGCVGHWKDADSTPREMQSLGGFLNQ